MFQSLQSFISYHVLTDERREALECRHMDCCCTVGVQVRKKAFPGNSYREDYLSIYTSVQKSEATVMLVFKAILY